MLIKTQGEWRLTFLKPACTLVATLFAVMRRPGDPRKTMVGVILAALLSSFGREELHAVVADQDTRGTSLAGVGLHGLLDRLARWSAGNGM